MTQPADIDLAGSEFERARALLADKREDEALDWFELAAEQADDPRVRASASAHVAALLLGFRRPWEVAEFTGRVRRDGGDGALAAMLDASACIQLGDALGALQLVGDDGAVVEPHDPWFPCAPATMWALRIRALHLAGRDRDAVAQLQQGLAASPSAPPLWEVCATLVADGVLAPDDVLDRLPSDDTTALFGWIAGAPLAGLDGLAEAIWSREPGAPVLAAATLFAWRLDADGALRWTLRLLTSGASTRSPVHERAERPAVAPADRVRAALVGAVVDESRSRAAVAASLPLVADDELLDLFDFCTQRAGTLADTFIVAAATSTVRCLLLASELARRGHVEEGFAVLIAGLSLPTADVLTGETFAELVPLAERDALAGVALQRGDLEVAGMLASLPAGA